MQTTLIHDRNSRTDCHSEIINFKPHIEYCQISVIKIEDISFIPLRTSNSYIAIPANLVEIDTICQTKYTLQKLDKPSIIRANTSCDILYKGGHMRIGETKNEVKYEMKTKTLALKTNDSFTHLLDKLGRAPKIIDNLQGYKTRIDKISDEIRTLNFEHRIVAALDSKLPNGFCPVARYTRTLPFEQDDCQMSIHFLRIFSASLRIRYKS